MGTHVSVRFGPVTALNPLVAALVRVVRSKFKQLFGQGYTYAFEVIRQIIEQDQALGHVIITHPSALTTPA